MCESEEYGTTRCRGAVWEDDLLFGMASPSCWGGKTGGDVEKRWPDDPGPRSASVGDLPVAGKLLRVPSCSFSFPGELER